MIYSSDSKSQEHFKDIMRKYAKKLFRTLNDFVTEIQEAEAIFAGRAQISKEIIEDLKRLSK